MSEQTAHFVLLAVVDYTAQQMMIGVEQNGQRYDLSANIRKTSDDWLIFMHGWGARKECFDEAFRHPELDGYSICSFDFLGYGESDKPRDFGYDLVDQAAISESLIRSLAPNKVTIVGHSMGGGIGLLVAKTLQDFPVTFISVEGNLVPEDTGSLTRLLAKQPLPLFKSVGFYCVEVALRFSTSPNKRRWAGWWASASPGALHASARSLVTWSDNDAQVALFESLPNKAYLYGEQSKTKQKYVLPRIAKEASFCIKRSGHFMMFDNADDFYGRVAEISQR